MQGVENMLQKKTPILKGINKAIRATSIFFLGITAASFFGFITWFIFKVITYFVAYLNRTIFKGPW